MRALGLIETYGFIGAVEAADVMLKVANVSLMKLEKVRGGLVTVTVAGDVGAVKTAVEAGANAVQRLSGSSLCSSHVIPRPDTQLKSILQNSSSEAIEVVDTDNIIESNHKDNTIVELSSSPQTIKTTKTVAEYRRQLEKTKAAELRELISNDPNISITEEKLASLVRKTMIAMLLEEYTKQVDNQDS